MASSEPKQQKQLDYSKMTANDTYCLLGLMRQIREPFKEMVNAVAESIMSTDWNAVKYRLLAEAWKGSATGLFDQNVLEMGSIMRNVPSTSLLWQEGARRESEQLPPLDPGWIPTEMNAASSTPNNQSLQRSLWNDTI